MTAPAEVIAGRYEVLGVLGEGGFGAVYRARDRELDREVAVKVLREGVRDDEHRARFEREAKVAAAVRGPQLIPVLDHGEDDGRLFLVSELIQGEDLERRLRARGPLPEAELLRLARELALALETIHDAGLVHRDVKPANVLLREDGAAVLGDLGLARPRRDGTLLTAEGLVLGTPGFMAPELLEGAPATARSDQFAWAVTIHVAAGGRPPYDLPSLPEFLRRIRERGEGWLPDLAPHAPPVLRRVLRRALAPDPAARWGKLVEAVDSPDAPAPEAPTRRLEAPPPTSSTVRVPAMSEEPGAPSAPRPGPRVGHGIVLVLVLGLGVVLGLASTRRPPPPATRPATPPRPSPGRATPTALARTATELAECFPQDLAAPTFRISGADHDATYPVLVSRGFSLKWSAFLRALEDDLAAAEREGVLARLLPRLRQVAGAIRGLSRREELRVEAAYDLFSDHDRPPLDFPPGWDASRFREVEEVIRETTAHAFCALLPGTRASTPWQAVTLAEIGSPLQILMPLKAAEMGCPPAPALPLGRALLGALATAEGPLLPWVAAGLLDVVARSPFERYLSGKDAWEFLTGIQARLEAVLADTDEVGRRELLHELATAVWQHAQRFPDRPRGPIFAAVDTVIARALAEPEPDAVTAERLARHFREARAGRLRKGDPEGDAILARLDSLAAPSASGPATPGK